MPTRNVVLTDRQQGVIETLVQSGRYQNASEVLREGLRLVEQRDREDVLKLEALRAAAQLGWDQLEAGNYVDVAEDQLDAFLGQLRALPSNQRG